MSHFRKFLVTLDCSGWASSKWSLLGRTEVVFSQIRDWPEAGEASKSWSLARFQSRLR